ncbi:MAG: hypothetical protein M3319_10150 [Actinomycetota bacterium]|nr:hypothetical protein [Actinomycetota bacterium]
MTDWLQRHQTEVVGYLTTGAGYFIEFITLLILTLFITFFFLYDGERIWHWLISPLPPREVVERTRPGGRPGLPRRVMCAAPRLLPPFTAS